MIQAIHTAVKGRVRYRVEPCYHSESLCRSLERSLSQQTDIKKVKANPLTGSLLVKFNPNKTPDEIATLIEESLPNFQAHKQESSSQTSKKPKKSTGEAQPTEDWYLREINYILEKFSTDQETGLGNEQVSQNFNRYGTNSLTESKSRSDWSILAQQFQSFPVALLGVASVISLLTGGLADAVAITGVVLINAVIGYTTESQSEKIIHSLQNSEKPLTLVIREDKLQEIDSEEIVLGDILVIQTNKYIAADARLIESDNLHLDESALTGESIAVKKQVKTLKGAKIPLGERINMVYQGTFVTQGTGKAVVVATGKFTEMGKIQGMVSEAEETATPLQKQLDEVGSQLVLLCTGVCGLTFGLGVLRGYGVLPMVKTAISLAVASVPEGLPTIATTTLALGMRDMRKRHILMRSLNAVEALGSVQTICLDKTGTITQNQMMVAEVHTSQGILKLKGNCFFLDQQAIEPFDAPALVKLLEVGVLCSDSEVNEKGEVKGSATENALIYMAMAANLDILDFRAKNPLIKTYPRTEDRNLMTTVHKTEEGQLFVAVKGNPEEVVKICTQRHKNGEIIPLIAEEKQELELDNERMAAKALRVLGFAYTYVDNLVENPEKELIWLGLTGMGDPIREGASDLMEAFHQAGIDTVMITGDQSPTAYAIAKELNLSRQGPIEIFDSADLSRLKEDELAAICEKVDVFARISPADKLQVVKALQDQGKIVAMTGDGINDTPALKTANVGVAMGSGKADIVREVADLVIEDDRLETMINAVSRGRTIYSNIRKSVHFLLSTNFSEIIVTTAATALGLGEPLNTMQLLWLNLVTDIFPGLALALEPPEPEVLNHPPRSPDEPIIQPSDFIRIASESGVISASALTAYTYALLKYGRKPQANTILFMSLTLAQILHTFSCRSESHSIFDPEKRPPNYYVDGAVVGSTLLQLFPLFIPGFRDLLQLAPLDLLDWMVIASSTGLPLIINESSKPTGEHTEL